MVDHSRLGTGYSTWHITREAAGGPDIGEAEGSELGL